MPKASQLKLPGPWRSFAESCRRSEPAAIFKIGKLSNGPRAQLVLQSSRGLSAPPAVLLSVGVEFRRNPLGQDATALKHTRMFRPGLAGKIRRINGRQL